MTHPRQSNIFAKKVSVTMRDPVSIYRDPLEANLIYMLRKNKTSGIWRVMKKVGTGDWRKVAGIVGSQHEHIAQEELDVFAYDNGLLKEIMDEEQAGV